MANDEQRKAFAAYMGGGGSSSAASAGQPIPQYPGSVADPANQYLFNVSSQFPGLGVPPAAPTPPPAAASSIVSYQGLQGGFTPHAAFGQARFPQRPLPLGQGQAPGQGHPSGAQSMSAGLAPSGYTQLARNYSSPPPPLSSHNVGWQYPDSYAPQSARVDLVGSVSGVMAPAHRNVSFVAPSHDKRVDEHFSYHYQAGSEAPPQVEEQTVPVLLCHTCSECGQMRSAGYHRNHPVIPGKPLVTTPCRKCKKRTKNTHRERANSYTRVRTCTAEDPCDWPREPVHVKIDRSEQRGRRRSRDEIYASWKTDHFRPHIIKEGTSRANIGLRTLQRSPPRSYQNTARVRMSALSPGRSRYDRVWPPPDVICMDATRPNDPHPASNEVWPPPDVVRTHSYRKQSPPRPSPRIVELSPSPPPARSRTSRVSYRDVSEERRPRSPVQRSESRIRIQSDPHPYRTVIPDRRVFSTADETSTNDGGLETASPRILKPADMTYETSYRRRTSLRDSQQSTNVEVGGPRVQFASERREDPHPDERSDDRKSETYHRYEARSYVDQPASPPIDRMERLHIRRSSPSPRRHYDEIRVDRARGISTSPPQRFERVRVRHFSVSPPPPREREARPPPSPPSSEQPKFSGYRHVSRAEAMERASSITPPPSRKQVSSEDDVTDSEDDNGGRLIEVRSWKGIDENGQPATYLEERRKIKMIDQGSVKGSEFRPLTEKLAARSWREV
ncbi:uncharacterized protein M421DRAFT_1889 [Didymella exigua CBS 183.55]|uniref:Uncharacterized protein n=1 Tax=Didymella exigua CBS 183.55 TaxID=1150837 RepID=A0A6A5RYZ5_9PLEO|nr:uncharacterized protein M421DRAFT_1889 [Didymella exigua CBS 183.55]KAF1932238.1 hypothetical protein M421DRAFT_1889 [Didymella exigua CBS 183.55]